MIGLISLNKPSGMSSSTAVVKIKKLAHMSRVGHMGTLDPLASGVLIIGVGKATRLFDYYLGKTKTYIATFKFGISTDTLDSEGQVLTQGLYVPKKEEILSILDKLTGEISQYPPQFSAKSVNGVRAYKLARQGIEVDLKPKTVNIKYIKLLEQVSPDEYTFEIDCSSGTYIRSIARDMGKLLNTEAIMTALVRTRCGVFTLDNSVNLDSLTEDNISQYITSLNDALSAMTTYNITDNQKEKLVNGVAVWVNLTDGQYCLVYENVVVGIGEVVSNNLKIKNFLME